MKHPFWIVNSALFFLVLFALIFIYFSQVYIPEREDIEPAIHTIKKEQIVPVNINKIYENDLFGTYEKEFPIPKEPEYTVPIPEPPTPQKVEIPELPKPQFLDPLNITLKGIFTLSNDSAKNRAVIMDNKTNKESTYKVGDTIEDAQLIRIFGNKIIFLRANGQQEVLYLREQDAKTDAAYAVIEDWDDVARSTGTNTYVVSPTAFINRVQNLAQLIDMLRLTTAYKQGQSIGSRIGQIEAKSFGTQVGLQPGDIIISINGISGDKTENRLKIYKDIVATPYDGTIKIVLLRDKEEQTLELTLHDFTHEELQKEKKTDIQELKKLEEKDKAKILKQKYEFAPTVQEIRKREKQNMLEKGRAPVNK